MESASILPSSKNILITFFCIMFLSPHNFVEHCHEDDSTDEMLRFTHFNHPSSVWVTSHFAHIKYWVGEDIDFGSSDLVNFFAQEAYRTPCSVFGFNCFQTNDLWCFLSKNFWQFRNQFFISPNNCPEKSQMWFFAWCRFVSWSFPRWTAAWRVVFMNIPQVDKFTFKYFPGSPSCFPLIFMTMKKTASMWCDVYGEIWR